jgi:hypothetical protein
MHITIQYDTHLKQFQVSGTLFVGELYSHILQELGVAPRQVICMMFNNHVLGRDPLSFDRSLSSCGFYNGAMIFVIFNHYPELTSRYSETTSGVFQQWENRERYQFESRRTLYDPVVDNSRLPYRMGAPQPSEVGDERYDIEDGDFMTFGPSPFHQPYMRQTPINRRQASQMRRTVYEGPPDHLRQVRNRTRGRGRGQGNRPAPFRGFQMTFNDNGPGGVTIETQFDGMGGPGGLDAGFANMLNGVMGQLMNGGNLADLLNLENVPVTLTEEQFNQLPVRTYQEVSDEYRQEHPDEQPQDRCPIARDQEFTPESQVVYLPGCHHFFSMEGIRPWLLEQNVHCPVCNSDVREQLAAASGETDNANDEEEEIEVTDVDDEPQPQRHPQPPHAPPGHAAINPDQLMSMFGQMFGGVPQHNAAPGAIPLHLAQLFGSGLGSNQPTNEDNEQEDNLLEAILNQAFNEMVSAAPQTQTSSSPQPIPPTPAVSHESYDGETDEFEPEEHPANDQDSTVIIEDAEEDSEEMEHVD